MMENCDQSNERHKKMKNNLLDHRTSLVHIHIFSIWFFPNSFVFLYLLSFFCYSFGSSFVSLFISNQMQIVFECWYQFDDMDLECLHHHGTSVVWSAGCKCCTASKPLIIFMGKHTHARTAFIYFAKVNKWKISNCVFLLRADEPTSQITSNRWCCEQRKIGKKRLYD